MPPRLPICDRCLRSSISRRRLLLPIQSRYASAQVVISSIDQLRMAKKPPPKTYPPTQPPAHRPPEARKSQLHRQYTSLLRSTPLMLLFQHNNLTAIEWMSLRRELAVALGKVDATRVAEGRAQPHEGLSDAVKLQVIQTGVFGAALRVVEYFHPKENMSPGFTHGLSRAAYEAVANKKLSHALSPILAGPLAVLTFPTVSTEHLKTALSILAPNAPNFPAPTRRLNPGYHDPTVQGGLQKLMLLGARVEGKVFDIDGTRWVGSIVGGLDGLRGQLVTMLQGIGAGITSTLEAAGKSLYFTVEGRRTMMDEEQNGPKEKGEGDAGAEAVETKS